MRPGSALRSPPPDDSRDGDRRERDVSGVSPGPQKSAIGTPGQDRYDNAVGGPSRRTALLPSLYLSSRHTPRTWVRRRGVDCPAQVFPGSTAASRGPQRDLGGDLGRAQGPPFDVERPDIQRSSAESQSPPSPSCSVTVPGRRYRAVVEILARHCRSGHLHRSRGKSRDGFLG